MADFTNSIGSPVAVYPVDAIDGQPWSRVEPLVTPELLARRFLLGIPLSSFLPDPLTNEFTILNNDDLQDFILRAVGLVEMDTHLYIFPVQFDDRKSLDKNELDSWGYFKMNNIPILSVDRITIKPNSSQELWVLPNEWVANGQFNKGIINIIPLIPSNSVDFVAAAGGNGAVFLLSLLNSAYIPNYWSIRYTAGFPNGQVPRIVNELVGIYAAQEILSSLGTTNRVNSASTGMDGMSQSTGTAGPNIYDPRIKLLEERKLKIIQRIKGMYGLKIPMSNI